MRLFDFFKKQKPAVGSPPEIERYLERFQLRLPKAAPVRQLRFVVLDTETTGLDLKNDRILTIAAVAVKDFGLRVDDRLEVIIAQAGYSPGESVSVHGITASQSSIGISEKEALLDVVDYLQDAILVGHHIQFDKSILDEALKRNFGVKLKNKTLDTATLEKRLKSSVAYQQNVEPPASLDALCEKYRIEMGERHTAAGDAFITGLVFMKQLARLEARGVTTAGELLR